MTAPSSSVSVPRSHRRGASSLIALLLLAGQGCTAGISTGVEEAAVPAAPRAVARLAVMPVTTEAGSEGVRPEMAPALAEALAGRFPALVVVPPEESRRLLSRSPAATDYADMVEDYERTGAVSLRRLRPVLRALGVDHFLQVRAMYLKEDFLDTYLFDDDVTMEERQVLAVVVRLWSAGEPGPVWEAVVRTRSETDDFVVRSRSREELVEALVRSLVERVPIARADGPEVAGGGEPRLR